MKYLMTAILAVLLASPVHAELLTEQEALAKMEAQWKNNYRNPENLTPEEWRRRDIEAVQKASREGKMYRGSGSYVSDRDTYIDGRLYHCVQYEFSTQCHKD